MSNRTYSQALNDGKGAANFPYIFDPSVVTVGPSGITTGAWRPYTSNDISNNNISVSGLNLSVGAVAVTGTTQVAGNVGISNTAPIPVSGVSTILSLPTHNVAVTGGSILTIVTGTLGGNVTVNSVAITGAPVVTITGVVATSASVTVGNVAVTGGNISVSNTAPIPVSGVVVTTVSVGNTAITGFNSTIAPLAVSGTFAATIGNIAVTGGRVSVTGGNISISNTAPIPISGITVLNSVPTHNVTVTGGQVSLTGGNVNIVSAINVAITGGSIRTITTGSFSASVDNTTLISAVASGNAYNAAISGLLSASTTDSAWVTGQVSITNTAPLPISGVVQASVTIGNVAVTGGSILNIETGNRSVSVVNASPIPISGVVVTTTTVSNVAITGFNSTIAPLAVSGVFTASIGNIASTGGLVGVTGFSTGAFVRTVSVSSSIASNSLPSGVAPFIDTTTRAGTALNANLNRLMFFVQNIHTGIPLYVLLGTTAAGTGNFSFILNPSSAQGWGGDSFSDSFYKGQVNVSGSAWNAWEV